MNQSDEAKKLMDLKQKRIAHFQDAKERSMAIMSSGRDAVMVVTSLTQSGAYTPFLKGIEKGELGPEDMDDVVKEEIKKWRKFFFYEIYGTDPDEEVKQQLKETLPPKQYLGF